MTSTRNQTAPSVTFVIADVDPSIRIAFPFEADAPTFGLDPPTRLLGAAALPPDALPSRANRSVYRRRRGCERST